MINIDTKNLRKKEEIEILIGSIPHYTSISHTKHIKDKKFIIDLFKKYSELQFDDVTDDFIRDMTFYIHRGRLYNTNIHTHKRLILQPLNYWCSIFYNNILPPKKITLDNSNSATDTILDEQIKKLSYEETKNTYTEKR